MPQTTEFDELLIEIKSRFSGRRKRTEAWKNITSVGAIGTDVFGVSQAVQHLAHEFDVVATAALAPSAESKPRRYTCNTGSVLAVLGLSPNASRDRLTFVASNQGWRRRSQIPIGNQVTIEGSPKLVPLGTRGLGDRDEVLRELGFDARRSTACTPAVLFRTSGMRSRNKTYEINSPSKEPRP